MKVNKVKLSDLHKQIEEYLKANGDAEVICIGTHSGSSKYGYTLNLSTGKINVEWSNDDTKCHSVKFENENIYDILDGKQRLSIFKNNL